MVRGALIDRRSFMRAAGVAFASTLSARGAFALERSDAVYASGYRAPDGTFGLALMSEQGAFVAQIDLPGRVHGLCYSVTTGMTVAFARRPGTFAMAIDSHERTNPVILTSVDGRHFYGHGCFSPDGRRLYASENDFEGNRGVIGVYDADDGFRRIAEFDAYGIGTHDLSVSDDGTMLIAANGGIETRPEFGRTKLNLDRMEPSLALIDANDGRLIEKHTLPDRLRQLSTRHISLAANGAIWFACQYEGPRNDLPPLIGHFSKGEDLQFVDLPDEITAGLANYVGAIAVNRQRGLVGATSPKGGLAVTLDAKSGRVIERKRLPDAAGIAAGGHDFVVSSYRGNFGSAHLPVAFDQHIARLSQPA
ncbi:DUF1513 domain-containing protein [Ciceribacter sp. L1K23]|uniref:DUF1513 domain-containing protein n=1 Tax=Ciceribacter sp. L1K23 TaxID=2820276 RepID=UPI001B83BC0A|nr:DUF1513 domain-containing protein [Ciceribacter sp. L1K23]MBR0557324.1 DUF1513 domain-containing protein [Ciceribacter sp. L1K23]